MIGQFGDAWVCVLGGSKAVSIHCPVIRGRDALAAGLSEPGMGRARLLGLGVGLGPMPPRIDASQPVLTFYHHQPHQTQAGRDDGRVIGRRARSVDRSIKSMSTPTTQAEEGDTTTPAPAPAPAPAPPQQQQRPATTFYRRPLPANLIAFSSVEGRRLFREALESGGMEGFFSICEVFQHQSDPAFCTWRASGRVGSGWVGRWMRAFFWGCIAKPSVV